MIMTTRDDLLKLSMNDLDYLVFDLKAIEAVEICQRDGKEVVDFILREGDFIDLPDHDLNVVMEMRPRLAKILSLIDEEDFVFAKVLIEDMDRDIKKDYRLDYVYGPQLVYAQGLIRFLEGE